MRAADAWQTDTCWLMVSAFFLLSASAHGCLMHLAPLLTDRGVSAQGAAFATSLLGGALVLRRVGAGSWLDRVVASAVAVGFFCGPTLGVILLSLRCPFNERVMAKPASRMLYLPSSGMEGGRQGTRPAVRRPLAPWPPLALQAGSVKVTARAAAHRS